MEAITVLTSKNFETFIQQSFALVDFWASWCGPCRTLAPILEKIAQEHAVAIGKMNIEDDETQSFAQRYQIRSIPTLLFFKLGQIVDTHTGFISEQELLSTIKLHMNLQ